MVRARRVVRLRGVDEALRQVGETRLHQRDEAWAVGVLATDDRAPGEALPPSDPHSGERAMFTIARVSHDSLDQSTIGAIFTDREFGGGYNRVGGVDANIKLNQNWRVQGAAVTSSSRLMAISSTTMMLRIVISPPGSRASPRP